MNQTELINSLAMTRVIPIIDPIEKEQTLDIVSSLVKGGTRHVEITFRSELAIEIFKDIRQHNTSLIMGAGSIVSHRHYELARHLGADFTISPGFDKHLQELTGNNETIHIPGIATPSELITANNYGVTLVKYFPAMAAGGFKTLKDLSRIFPKMFFMPSGGITKSDLHGFAKIRHVASVGGSWMFKDHLKVSTQNEMREAIELMRMSQ